MTTIGEPPLMEVKPRILNEGKSLGSPDIGSIFRLATAPCSAEPTLLIGLSTNFLVSAVATEPERLAFFCTA